MTQITDRTWTSTDGLTLYARDHAPASGPAKLPVICIHGLTRNSRDFEVVAPRIATHGRRVLSLDVRGRGCSDRDPNPANYHVGIYAADVAALLDQSGVSRAIFIGTSMGRLITMTLAALRPDLIGGAVLNDIGPEVGAAGIARIASYVGGAPSVNNWAEATAYVRNINGEALPDLTEADWERFARRVFRDDHGTFSLDYDPAISQAFKTAPAETPDLWPLFTALAADRPLLLVRGETSDILDAEIASRMAAAAPHMQRADIAGVGHAPTLEEPASLAALDAFLAAAP
jgi:pimeloyl-ACP methyl ester carboxylesterase